MMEMRSSLPDSQATPFLPIMPYLIQSLVSSYKPVKHETENGKVIEENKDPEVRIAIVIGPAIIHDDEGLCVFVPMPGMKNNHVNVTVENNLLLCIGTRPDGKPATCIPEYGPKSLLPNKSYKRARLEAKAWQQCGTYHCMVELPDKTYTPSEVEAKMKDCVLRLRFTNITKEDVEPFMDFVY
ncbi:hypothetical protein Tco_1211157 [Tanacetum coccineum]